MSDEQDINTRLANLEQLVIKTVGQDGAQSLQPVHPTIPAGLAIAAIATGYLGLGLPQHYYQPVFAGLILALLYHRQSIYMSAQPWRWPLVVLNFAVLVFLMKFLIGGGIAHPFSWLQVPGLGAADVIREGWSSWFTPNLEIKWGDVSGITRWQIDITLVQSLFLVFTLAGVLMRFQVFASMTALLLLIISIPTLLQFNWQWVIWFLVATTVCFYVQTGKAVETLKS